MNFFYDIFVFVDDLLNVFCLVMVYYKMSRSIY